MYKLAPQENLAGRFPQCYTFKLNFLSATNDYSMAYVRPAMLVLDFLKDDMPPLHV